MLGDLGVKISCLAFRLGNNMIVVQSLVPICMYRVERTHVCIIILFAY